MQLLLGVMLEINTIETDVAVWFNPRYFINQFSAGGATKVVYQYDETRPDPAEKGNVSKFSYFY